MSSSSTTTNDEEAVVRCGTSKGPIVIRFYRHWSPHGYDRAVALFEKGFYDHSHFFRVVPDFLVQFGISYTNNAELKRFADSLIPDDPQLEPPIRFEAGTVSYAGSGPNSRNSQLFFAYRHTDMFGTELWETPLGKVVEGMENVKKFYSYGDMPPWGKGPVQGRIHNGRQYIDENFPLTDSFGTCQVERIRPGQAAAGAAANPKVAADADTAEQHKQQQHHHLQDRVKERLIRAKSAMTKDALLSGDWRILLGAALLLTILWIFARSLLGPRKKQSKKN